MSGINGDQIIYTNKENKSVSFTICKVRQFVRHEFLGIFGELVKDSDSLMLMIGEF